MADNFKMKWDQTGEKFYETGTDRGALYPMDNSGAYPKGVVWNGLTGVTESPSGADKTDIYADNIKYLTLRSAEDFGATLTCYTYPDEWMECDGSRQPLAGVTIGQQSRKAFGLSYRTLIGNDIEGTEYGYKLHLIWNATASPSERAYKTVNDSPEAIEFSYELATTPTAISGYKPIASMTIDSTKVAADRLAALEEILYGTGTTDGRLPLPDEVISILGGTSTYSVTVIPSRVELTAGDTYSLRTEVSPSGTEIAWSSSNTSYATVGETGIVTAVAAGTATITATITDGDSNEYTGTCSVVVSAAAEG